MTGVPAAGEPVAPSTVADVRSPLSDGQWHRLHPLTPVLRGGLFLLVVIGIVVTNLRDRLITWFVPGLAEWEQYEQDPVDYVLANNLWLIAMLVVLGVLVVLVAIFWMSWRFHTFRITGDDVEVRSGILFRTHRRAPLDRVQGVNLTRPMVARLLGAAKLEVVGAGLDANVKLEYLSTANAEAVRADILRLASGRQLAEAQAAEARGLLARAAAETVTAGLNGLFDGVDLAAEPESVVHITPGRVIASRLLSGSTLWLVVLIGAVIVGSVIGTPWLLFSIVPALLGFGAYWFRSITRALRYSIAPTPSGVRITSGLFTTTTETLPPGRVHAFEIRQPILWRPFGWWALRVNRLSGRSATDTKSQEMDEVLPVGTRDDVERVLKLFLPGISAAQSTGIAEHGMLGPQVRGDDTEAEDRADAAASVDPYTTTPRRARWLRPLSWRRNGFLLAPDALLLRHGVLRRALVILPLARLQSVRIAQGPVDRALSVAGITGHTVAGMVSGGLGVIDRDDAYALWQRVAAAVIVATAQDHSHRWDAAPAPVASALEAAPAASSAPAGPEAAPAALSAPAEQTADSAQRVAFDERPLVTGASRLGVGIIGAGRVGPVLGAALAGAGHALTGITAGSDQERVEAILPGVPVLPADEVVRRSELVIVAVPSAELAGVVAGLADLGAWQGGQLVLHTDPAFGVAPLAPAATRGAIPLAVHPAIAFTGTTIDLRQLRDAYAAVTAPAPVLPIAQALAVELGCEPVVIAEADRPAYGEAIATASEFSASIVRQSARLLDAAGVPAPGRYLSALVHSTVERALVEAGQGAAPDDDAL